MIVMIGYNFFPNRVFTHVLGYQDFVIIVNLSKLNCDTRRVLILQVDIWEIRFS